MDKMRIKWEALNDFFPLKFRNSWKLNRKWIKRELLGGRYMWIIFSGNIYYVIIVKIIINSYEYFVTSVPSNIYIFSGKK